LRLPPPKDDLEARVERVASLDSLLHSLALKLEDEDRHCRKAFNDVLRLADEKLYRLRLAVDAVTLSRSYHYRLGSLDNRAELVTEVLPDAPQIWLVHWKTLLSLGRIPGPDETDYLINAEDVPSEYPGDTMLVPVIHRPRSEDKADPYGVTCRQLVTFAKWYLAKWGETIEMFFWIDICCMPEVAEAEAELERQGGSEHSASDGRSRSSSGTGFWSLPSVQSSRSSKYSTATRFSTVSRFSRFSKSSRLSRLSGAAGMNIRTTVQKRGLKNLQAWMQDGEDDTKSVRSGASKLSSINFRDRVSVINGMSEGVSGLVLKGRNGSRSGSRSGSKMSSTKFQTLTDLHRKRIEREARSRLASLDESSRQGSKIGENPLVRLGLENPDINMDMLRDGSDVLRLLVFAAADAVVLCETHDSEDSAWVRMGLALARAFAPTGHTIYAVERSLVHVPQARKPGQIREMPKVMVRSAIGKLAEPLSPQAFPGAVITAPLAPSSPNAGPGATGGTGQGEPETTLATRDANTDLANAVRAAIGEARPECIWREMIPEFQENTVLRTQEEYLLDPTAWNEVHLERPKEDKARIVRLTALCLDRPTAHTVGIHRRPPLEFGESTVSVCRLEAKRSVQNRWRRAFRKQKQIAARRAAGPVSKPVDATKKVPEVPVTPPESSSSGESDGEGSGEGEDDTAPLDEDVAKRFKHQRKVMDWTERSWDLYYKNKQRFRSEEDTPSETATAMSKPPESVKMERPVVTKPVQTASSDLLRRAADMRNRWGEDTAPRPMLHPVPQVRRGRDEGLVFHPEFRPRHILIGAQGRTAEEMRARNVTKQASVMPSQGGMAIVSRPLKVRGAVCPDKYKALGVIFDIKVEGVDQRWRDGLGIGFTAQDPDQWPSNRPNPRHAAEVPRSCLCGYSGRWVVEGRSELIQNSIPGQGTWEPGSLRVGDVVTAVAAAPPADVVRILVNGRLVAERPITTSGLPDPTQAPLWGLVELDGACVKVRLGMNPASAIATDLTEIARQGI